MDDRVQTERNLIQRINLGDSLSRTAAARPHHLAVVDGDRTWTYAELNAWVNQLANGLARPRLPSRRRARHRLGQQR